MKLIGHLFIENFANLFSKLVFNKRLVTLNGPLQRRNMMVVGHRNWFELSQPFLIDRQYKIYVFRFF